jgi:large subunit ribosomal protein L4
MAQDKGADKAADKTKPEAGNWKLDVKTVAGGAAGSVSVTEAALGGMVKNRLMHAAAVMYHANKRAGTHCTKTRGEVAGSTRKLYRQKGTGRARAGSRKSGLRKHGGTIHGPKPKRYGFQMPKKQRRAALNSAVLGKLKDNEVAVIDGFSLTEPKTKAVAEALTKIGLLEKGKNPSLLILTDGKDENVLLSARNIPGVSVLAVQDANAREILTRKRILFTKGSFDVFTKMAERTYEKKARKLKGTRKSDTGHKSVANAPAGAAAGAAKPADKG